ncbi:hypothetical protein BH11ACT3_BH11ACT3_26000 [soil metagenome]
MTAKIVFSGAPARDRSVLDSWSTHARKVTGLEAKAESAVGPVVVWHLAASNYRVLARSVQIFDERDDAQRDALAAAAAAASGQLTPRLVKNGYLGAYGWYAVVESTPVLTCARWYSTERDRRDSIRIAMAALVEALPALRDGVATPARTVGRR